jgi:hypothetical protein
MYNDRATSIRGEEALHIKVERPVDHSEEQRVKSVDKVIVKGSSSSTIIDKFKYQWQSETA